MPKRKKSFADQHELYESNDSDDDCAELIDLPNPDDSGDSDEESDNEDFHSSNLDGNIEDLLSQYTYRKISKCYRDDQTKLENEHPTDKNPNDKAWRVRVLMNKFRKNIQRFGYFQTALSIDEMMAKSYARTSLLQFIRGKPIRRGLKFWGCCTSDGFLLDFDLYCGKDTNANLLNKCSLGSRVVMNLLVPFSKKLSSTEIPRFHLYFDNFFTNFDLILHLQKLGLRCTGTIRDNRVPKEARNVIDKKALRGTCIAKHDQNSGINYISIKDSKQVSIASSIAGVSPKLPSQRYSAEKKARVDVHFLCAFHTHNKFMGGVDLHDNHCNNVLPCIRSKKWTWVVLIRLIQSAIVNALVLYNTCKSEDKKVGSKDFTMSVARQYLENGKKHRSKKHEVSYKELKKNCSTAKCPIRTAKFCNTCSLYFCKTCFDDNHEK
ncbi:piggyBac transposable element-derived protein 3-like [Phymastichus coffea]|uniref:piggyBac transposable element-derived protein 3-like n=1 Tax=Phymastichus coffea TaxID=108790 RepID=UPI00273C07DA|nr:piggyBac transposable element-derived protein 3-like [Phymastichus coffea]